MYFRTQTAILPSLACSNFYPSKVKSPFNHHQTVFRIARTREELVRGPSVGTRAPRHWSRLADRPRSKERERQQRTYWWGCWKPRWAFLSWSEDEWWCLGQESENLLRPLVATSNDA